MKIIKYIGVFVAVHVFALFLIFAIPGCSSTRRAARSTPADTLPTASPVIMAAPAISSQPAPAGGGGPSLSLSTFDPNAPAVAADPGRAAPTRPGTAAAAPAQPSVRTHSVVSGDSLWNLAKANQLTLPELLAANPNLSSSSVLRPGQKILIPGKAAAPAASEAAGSDLPVYRVRSGDMLAAIARRANTTVAVLRELNGLQSDQVVAGRDLKLPPGTNMAAFAAGAAPAAAAAAAGKSAAAERSASSVGAMTHVVKSGENLSTIAQKYEVSPAALATENNIADPNNVRAGTTLIIPGYQAPKSGSAPAAGTAPPASAKAPPAEQDLDAALRNSPSSIPIIRIDEGK